jgi:hypothetical protein
MRHSSGSIVFMRFVFYLICFHLLFSQFHHAPHSVKDALSPRVCSDLLEEVLIIGSAAGTHAVQSFLQLIELFGPSRRLRSRTLSLIPPQLLGGNAMSKQRSPQKALKPNTPKRRAPKAKPPRMLDFSPDKEKKPNKQRLKEEKLPRGVSWVEKTTYSGGKAEKWRSAMVRREQNLQDMADALAFAKVRSYEVIEGEEDFENICRRLSEVYRKFFDLPGDDGSDVMYEWLAWLGKTCDGDPYCIDCRKGRMEAGYDPMN